ncbi:MAG TPA: NAD-dependent epimerase/dehydratase family protein, partial [Chloroflexota bacterium]|nr:NAD-dependent epimerase/dehydratase family protein [Chloroflexota bacterium]
ALVCGAGGFIGAHLVRRLRDDGYWVRGVDQKEPEFAVTAAQEFLCSDLRDSAAANRAVRIDGGFDEVYQLAADMGGMGFIHSAETQIMRNNILINVNMVDAAAGSGARRYFFSSSVCVYRDMAVGEPALHESDAYPALPDNEYGWEKLYAERLAQTYGRSGGMVVRIARFQNCFGPLGTWRGGREKAPAAICRKVAEAPPGGEIEVWGDGSAVRSYIYVADLVDGVVRLTRSDLDGPVNIGTSEYVTVDDLVGVVAEIAGKKIRIRHVDGPVGVQSRNFSHARIESLGWKPSHSLRDGIALTYPWVDDQVHQAAITVAEIG